ncbi:hypothetical protein PtrM4_083040 [Pyrenophora tritici-repentis]|uniref:DUF4246 domain-containing protein n=1 Tax=Pyrenophora tritici-repentis TaxID=45151 RepID=A0A834VSV6_9PLEO|nr:DUF4246 domain containing protein [Pyrenophora tritici-repentis]KAF7573399.1 hypothetical protein PtrM4_083040 [Pyrenophora tritici-repentis]
MGLVLEFWKEVTLKINAFTASSAPARIGIDNGLPEVWQREHVHAWSQHRVSSFKLTDPTKPGYVGFIALYLVDSTANIPPQQMDSYIDSLLGTDRKTKEESTAKLLPDLVQLLVDKGATGITDDRQGRLPRKLWNWVGDGFEEDDHMLPLTQEGRPFKQSLLECVLAFAKAGHKGKL